MKIISAAQAKEMDRISASDHGIPVMELMGRAAGALFEAVLEEYGQTRGLTVTIVCGKGNNGGDGFALALLLLDSGADVRLCVHPEAPKGAESVFYYKKCVERSISMISAEELPALLENSTLAVDALYGSGFRGEPDSWSAAVIKMLNSGAADILSVDLPSGVYADGGRSDTAVNAGITVALGLPKRGNLLPPSFTSNGRLHVRPIGFPKAVLEMPDTDLIWDRAEDLHVLLPDRPRDAHKGTFGHLLVLGGGCNDGLSMAGAVLLAGLSALRAGCGLLTIAASDSLQGIVQAFLPEAMFLGLDTLNPGQAAAKTVSFIRSRGIKTVLAGNGMGTGDYGRALLSALFHSKLAENLVLDADALSILAGEPEFKKAARDFKGSLLLTPHAGEASRLLGRSTAEVVNGLEQSALDIAREYNCSVTLKTAVSIITSGGEAYVNTTGGPVLAKGGSGDILAGMTASFKVQGLENLTAQRLASYILGRAGEIYALRSSARSALAREIADLIPAVFNELERSGPCRE